MARAEKLLSDHDAQEGFSDFWKDGLQIVDPVGFIGRLEICSSIANAFEISRADICK